MIKRLYRKVKNDFVSSVEENTKRLISIQSVKDSALINQSSLINTDANDLTERKLIVSLTTFGKRIRSVYITLESIARQTHKPDKIILWLAEDEFTIEDIPNSLKKMLARGLEIKFCKDIKSYKKLIYTVRDFPNDIIITIDDDIIYDVEMIEGLYDAHLKYPNCICCHRSHVIKQDEKGKHLPYDLWGKSDEVKEPSLLQFPTGVGGVLYFPGCFDDEFFNEEKFQRVAPSGDDFWFKAMTWKNNIKIYNPNVYSSACPVCIVLDSSKIGHLAAENVIGKKNDNYMQNIVKEYNLKLN
ncbi:hypothetical protein [Wenyingzhuangia sp. IMCC45574]